MLRRIHIQRFRGFETLEADLSPATIVVGPNSSGKTSLLYAIRLALRALADGLHAGTSRRAKNADKGWIEVVGDALVSDHTRYLSVADWQSLFYNQRTGENQSLAIHLIFDDDDRITEIKVDVRCGRNAQLKLGVWICAPELAKRTEGLSGKSGAVNREIVEYVERHAPQAVLVPSFYGVVREEEYRAGIVVDRLLGAGDQSHIVRNLVSRLSADAFTRLNAFLRDSLGAELIERTVSADSDRVYPLVVRFRDEDGPLELSAAGAGLINLIALYTALERYRSEQQQRAVIFLLDEPEAHLHPRLQGDMADRVTSLIVRDFGSQVVMATHAVEIVNRLFARDDTTVLRVDRGAQRVSALHGQEQIITELDEWADLTPFSLINFLASRRLLFYEGPSDRAILDRCAELRYRNTSRLLERYRRWTPAALHGSGNDKLVGLIGRLIDSKLIPALTDDTPLQLLLLLDQDYARQPGVVDERDGTRVHATRVVWPLHSIESLFLRPEVLGAWLRARWGADTPADIDAWISEAITATDGDETINGAAIAELAAKISIRGLVGADDQPLRGERLFKTAFEQASALVRAEPARWQRGHNRSRAVLGGVRERLAAKQRNQFPTDVHKLLQTTPLDHFGEPERAIPAEIRDLLDRMVQP